MNLPIRQALKQIAFIIATLAALLLVITLSMPRAAAQTRPITQTGTTAVTSTNAVTSTGATTATKVLTTTGIPIVEPIGTSGATTATNPLTTTGAITPTANPNLPGNQLTGIIPEGNPSDVVEPADLTPGAGTPSVPPPPPNVNFSQDQAPLGSWPVTIALVLIVLGVAWGAYQFLRKPATLPTDGEADMLVRTITPDEPKQVAPLTNEAVATDIAKADEAATAVMPTATDETVAEEAAADTAADDSAVAAAAAAAPAVAAAPPVAQPLDLADDLLPYLETLSRADEQLEYVLDRTYITVGRARTNDIVIDNSFVGWQTVSPYHAELRYQNGKFVVVDKQSDNGTFVNRVRTGSNVLDDGMSISFGKVEFIYRQPAK